jgi:hypothetical protein
MGSSSTRQDTPGGVRRAIQRWRVRRGGAGEEPASAAVAWSRSFGTRADGCARIILPAFITKSALCRTSLKLGYAKRAELFSLIMSCFNVITEFAADGRVRQDGS